ncbi:serine hydrolase [Asticcacaulis sp. SL142]|uniref:serine hydrolase n=1 Tax=Asticcacaulis sp. SL142 TaxID=2995155 RepID=UPI00226C6732|nr:serine hydrolase [Asticcacaulis sp. SL142]WAC49380.1 serine hydrolase [Asticcacaulis sp. SL142]
MIQSYVDADQFMGAVLVVKDGQIVLDKGYGFADRDAKTPITPDTRFYIASVTKQFTATSILLLEERGKLSTDDPVGKYLPGLPAAWNSVPLKNLLTHTSGIPDWGNQPQARAASRQPITAGQMLAYVSDKPLDFPTDTAYAYSNTNYVLLAMVVEKVSGKPFGTFLQANIFKPLKMEATRYNVPLTGLKGYVSRPGGLDVEIPPVLDHTSSLGDSGISTTTHDLLKWQQGLDGGKLLKPASLTRMTTAYKNDRGVNGNNGFGVVIRAPRGEFRRIEHGGTIPGFSANLAWYPDLRLSVIILENVEPRQPAPSPGEMRNNLVAVMSGKDAPAPVVHKEVPINTAVLPDYPGTYELSPSRTIVITLEGTQLFAESPGQWRLPVFPEAENRFFAKALEVQFEFVRGADGKVASMILHQSGRQTPGTRR